MPNYSAGYYHHGKLRLVGFTSGDTPQAAATKAAQRISRIFPHTKVENWTLSLRNPGAKQNLLLSHAVTLLQPPP